MKKVKQATTKKSFLSLSGSEIGLVVTAMVPRNEGHYDVNFSTPNGKKIASLKVP